MKNTAVSVNTQKYQSHLEQKIKEAAERKPIDINKLALESGLSESAFYKMFKTGTARLNSLEKIASILEIGVHELLPNFQSSSSISSIAGQKESLNGTTEATAGQQSGNGLQLILSRDTGTDLLDYVPYYDVEITAGRLEELFNESKKPPQGYIYAPHYRDCIACHVKGDSMNDRIFPGSRLYVYYLKSKKYIDFGQVYLVVLEGYRLLKYIDPDPADESRVILRSHNDEQYKNWSVEKADILHLFLVKGYENQNAN